MPTFELTIPQYIDKMLKKISANQEISKAMVIKDAIFTLNALIEELSKNEEYEVAIVDKTDKIVKKLKLIHR